MLPSPLPKATPSDKPTETPSASAALGFKPRRVFTELNLSFL